jgi:valyl-tRNA synthetase
LSLPKRYDANEAEPRWQRYWEEKGVFRFRPGSGKPLYTIDTPPPTVSGMIHMGHVFSYVQAEAVARYHRMRGEEVFYPFCFDDNGLPSERFTESEKGVRAQDMPRGEFVKLCLEVTKEAERDFHDLWARLGFSCDWDLLYTTIDPWVQKMAQRSFLRLYDQGRIYRTEAPTLWCPECMTAVAQAETEDSEVPSRFYDLLFPLADGSGTIPIATTRPELLPACVSIFVNPADGRFAHLVGKRALVPLFGREVEVRQDHRVDMEKGSGIVMCCTFGDTTDIDWWREFELELRIVIDGSGRMNEAADFLQGMDLIAARRETARRLEDEGLLTTSREIAHPVNVHERCGTPLEYLVNEQWFVRVLDMKEDLVRRGREINWYPPHFQVRLTHWIENLKWDWCISRQKYFGVPFPVWFCDKCGQVVLADEDSLPVDPLEGGPPQGCPSCGSRDLSPERDVMDTWMTSSLTPLINAKWEEEDQREGFVPMSMRPQAHDIIRTWAFYTVTKSHLHTDSVPWRDLMVSGHALNPSREKMSKSKGNVAGDPLVALEQYSADELRYWACRSKLGSDVMFSEDILGDGRRLVTKIFNATRFASSRLEGYDPTADPDLAPFDRWILSRLTETVRAATEGFDRYEYSVCMRESEDFFWHDLCDNYLEIAKGRLYDDSDHQGRAAAQHALYAALYGVMRLMAPVLVHVTEELYQAVFRSYEGHESIHVSPWPETDYMCESALRYGSGCLEIVEEARRYKSENNLSMATPLTALRVEAPGGDLESYREFEPDLLNVTRAGRIDWAEGPELSVSVENGTRP